MRIGGEIKIEAAAIIPVLNGTQHNRSSWSKAML